MIELFFHFPLFLNTRHSFRPIAKFFFALFLVSKIKAKPEIEDETDDE